MSSTALSREYSASNARVIVPHDTTSQGKFRSLFVGSAGGNISLVTLDGDTVLFTAVPIGELKIGCSRVNSTDTTSTNIVGLVL